MKEDDNPLSQKFQEGVNEVKKASQSVMEGSFWAKTAYDAVKSVFGEIKDDIVNSAPATYLGRLNRLYLNFILKNVPETPAEVRAFNVLHSKFVQDLKDFEDIRKLMVQAEETMRPVPNKNRRDSFQDLNEKIEYLNAYYSRRP